MPIQRQRELAKQSLGFGIDDEDAKIGVELMQVDDAILADTDLGLSPAVANTQRSGRRNARSGRLRGLDALDVASTPVHGSRADAGGSLRMETRTRKVAASGKSASAAESAAAETGARGMAQPAAPGHEASHGFDELLFALVSPRWQSRHGACTALRAIVAA